jgi:hypothetical protein
VTIEKGGFATLRAQRQTRVSENIITSLFRIGGTMKKLLVSTMSTLLLVIVFASATFAAPAAAERELLLKGSLQAHETNEVNFPTLFVNASGSGEATQLGRYAVSYQVQVNIPTIRGIASAQFVAANGDSLFAEGLGQATETGTPGVVTIVEMYTITGGTGRFEGASGTITVERVLDQGTGETSGTLNGKIVLP